MATVPSSPTLRISGICVSCSKAKKLRVVVSAPTQERALESKSKGKTTQLFIPISPSFVLRQEWRVNVVVYQMQSWRLDKKFLDQEFSYKTLQELCLEPSALQEPKVYELSSAGGIVIKGELEMSEALPSVLSLADTRPQGVTNDIGTKDVWAPQTHGTSLVQSYPQSSAVSGAERGVEMGAASKNGTKDSVLSNLSAGLEIVHLVGKFVPFIEPIGAILSTLVDVYKEVEGNHQKRDALVTKSAALARDISQAISRLKDLDHVDLISRLDPDLKEYESLLADVQNRVTEAFDDRGKLIRVIQRGELGGELDSLDDKLSVWGTRFRNNRLVDIQIEQKVLADSVRKILDTKLESDLEKWFDAPDPKEKQSRFCGVRNRSPCSWLFEHDKFVRWQNNPGQLLWIEGKSGTGKTIISSMIIEQLFDDRATLRSIQSTAIAYYYFDITDVAKQSVESALRRLVLQLSRQSPAPYEIMRQQHVLCDGQTIPTYPVLLDLLEKLLAMFGRTYLILDALDECKTDDHDRVAEFVAKISAWSHARLHVLVTSQARDVFERTFLVLQNLSRITSDTDATSDDIRLYISNELASSSELQLWKLESGRITKYIVDKSAGMFRLAYCLLEQVKQCARLDDLQRTLDALPDNLHGIYARSLKSVPKDYLPDVGRLLRWLAFSARPLTLIELEDTIAFDFSNPERYTFEPRRRPKRGIFMKWLSGLVSITNPEGVLDPDGFYRSTSRVSLAHSSVLDYLQQQHPNWCNSCPIHICEEGAHQFMAQSCVCYLLHFGDHPLDAETFPNYPLATYAARNWSYHLLRCSDQVALSALTKCLLVAGSRPYTALSHLNCWVFGDERSCLATPAWPRSIEPPLYMCARLGYAEGLKFLIDMGADVNTFGINGTALQCASGCGHIDAVKLLLERGVDLNARSASDGTALQQASANGHIGIVKLLLEKGAHVDAQGECNGTALQRASAGGHMETVKVLLEMGADIDAQGGWYGAALQRASTNGHNNVVKFLLEQGADINAQGRGDGTALQLASRKGHLEVVKYLLEKGADVDARNSVDGTALQLAVGRGHISIVQLLLEKGADVNAEGGGKGTALQRASSNGSFEIAELLLEHGADVDAQGGWRGTALQSASENGHIKLVRLLLENGATKPPDEDEETEFGSNTVNPPWSS